MNATTLRTAYHSLHDAAAFADRHHEIRDAIMRHIDNPPPLPNAAPTRLTIPAFERDWHETLTNFIVAARRDAIPVTVDFEGSYMWADLDFDGLVLRVMDYHTTCGKRYGLEALAGCPIDNLDRVLAVILENRKAGS